MQVRKAACVWLGVSGLLVLLAPRCWVVSFLGAAALGLVLADLLLKCRDIFWTTRLKMRDVKDKAVLVTGCDTGFGNQLAGRLARMGFKVYAGCLMPEGEGAKTLARTGKIRVLKMDVTKQEDVDQVFQDVKEDLETNGLSLWSVVNNAGIAMMGEVEFTSMANCRRVLEVNTLAPVRVTKTFLPLLRAAGQGRVVNVASQAGRFTGYGFTTYSMSKHALVSFSDGLRLEMKKWNISVHSIEPALYKTPIVDMNRYREDSKQMWTEANEDTRAAYGATFFQECVERVCDTFREAKLAVHEVVDDMEDAVAGLKPEIRYTPNTVTKALVRVLRELPTEAIDVFLMQRAPKGQPAHSGSGYQVS